MKKSPLFYGVVGGLIGAAAVWLFSVSVVNSNDIATMKMMGYSVTTAGEEIVFPTDWGMMGMDMSMNAMLGTLLGRANDEFDRSFIEAMIAHHQGAIEMARLARTQAKHTEIKNLADDIIRAQEGEIQQMKRWWTEWGY